LGSPAIGVPGLTTKTHLQHDQAVARGAAREPEVRGFAFKPGRHARVPGLGLPRSAGMGADRDAMLCTHRQGDVVLFSMRHEPRSATVLMARPIEARDA